jgi:hypothetical protein
MASAEQYRLSLQVDACLAVFQDKFDNVLDLRRFIGRYDKLRALARWFVGNELLVEAPGRLRDHRVARLQYRLRRAVILLELHDVRGRRKLLWEIQNIPHCRGSKMNRSIVRRRRQPLDRDRGASFAIGSALVTRWCLDTRRPGHGRTVVRQAAPAQALPSSAPRKVTGRRSREPSSEKGSSPGRVTTLQSTSSRRRPDAAQWRGSHIICCIRTHITRITPASTLIMRLLGILQFNLLQRADGKGVDNEALGNTFAGRI